MCRLFGMISSKASSALTYLADAECSLLQQSRVDNERLQGDGWGIGYYAGGLPRVVKSEKPVYSEVERYRSAALRARSKVILAHVRKASNPRGLPREKIISVENSQPFYFGRFLFAHNGTINIPDEAAGLLGKYRSLVKGVNDSEIYFWFLVKSLEGGSKVEEALAGFEDALERLWQVCCRDHPTKKRPYVGLNAVFSDGERLYAYCRYSEEDGNSPSLCLRDQPAFQMCYRPGEPLVVASEKLDRKGGWIPLGSGQLLTAWEDGTRVMHEAERIR
ncbi:MAG: class II glutamine amidotransferase [Candidatus Brockarchaeota archaeon]|nr:class II glutamine amidotransferase [Candidatus Brockarchaeota archaeon]